MGQYYPNIKIGYLGGGQLAQMLAESAHQLGLTPYVMSLRQDSPAAQNCRNWIQGSIDKESDLEKFLKSVDVATFESEFLNAKLLQEVQFKTKTKIYPSPKIMGQLQDRKSQKALFDKHKLPTSPWTSPDSLEDVEKFIKKQKYPVVFKKRFFGYDGYGTFIVKSATELKEFLESEFKPEMFIVEKFIAFKKEVAVIVARSNDKSFTHFPFVQSYQKDSRCDWVQGPLKLTSASAMLTKIKSFLKKIDYVGVMGIEFFMTSKGLIINEIAPRVHNSGHYSQDTKGFSQFDLHNLCLLGQKMPKEIKIKGGFAMANLVGTGKKTSFQATSGMHWYGKSENRPGRKMGHINCTGVSGKEALKQALKKRKGIQL